MRQTLFLALVFSLACCGLGCTLITTFDDPRDGGMNHPYSLDENMEESVSVDLLENGNATITLPLTSPLPDSDDTDLAALLEQDTIGLVVTKDNGITANLTSGTRVETTPTNPGEYFVTISDDRLEVEVEFRNETTEGRALHETNNYTAAVKVQTNTIFAVEEFTRPIVFE